MNSQREKMRLFEVFETLAQVPWVKTVCRKLYFTYLRCVKINWCMASAML